MDERDVAGGWTIAAALRRVLVPGGRGRLAPAVEAALSALLLGAVPDPARRRDAALALWRARRDELDVLAAGWAAREETPPPAAARLAYRTPLDVVAAQAALLAALPALAAAADAEGVVVAAEEPGLGGAGLVALCEVALTWRLVALLWGVSCPVRAVRPGRTAVDPGAAALLDAYADALAARPAGAGARGTALADVAESARALADAFRAPAVAARPATLTLIAAPAAGDGAAGPPPHLPPLLRMLRGRLARHGRDSALAPDEAAAAVATAIAVVGPPAATRAAAAVPLGRWPLAGRPGRGAGAAATADGGGEAATAVAGGGDGGADGGATGGTHDGADEGRDPAGALDAADELAHRLFGFAGLRPFQRALIGRALAGRSTLGVAATGGGKSECYLLPALLLPGATVVVTPLKALMADQLRERLGRRYGLGGCATSLSGDVAPDERRARLAALADGAHALLYLTPEQLAREATLAALVAVDAARGLQLLAVDEAHCLSQWGHDFRSDYLGLYRQLRARGLAPARLALTATASQPVRDDICDELALAPAPAPAGDVFVDSGNRPEIDLVARVLPTTAAKIDDLVATLGAFLATGEGGAIVFLPHTGGPPGLVRWDAPTAAVRGRLSPGVSRFAAYLEHALQHRVALYHGAMDEGEGTAAGGARPHGDLGGRRRQEEQDRFVGGRDRIMVATKGFGMGIDKPDVRLVLHRTPPATIEAYAQEAGRAGRDGRRATAILYYAPPGGGGLADRSIQEGFFAQRYLRAADVEALWSFCHELVRARDRRAARPGDRLAFRVEEAVDSFARRAAAGRYTWPALRAATPDEEARARAEHVRRILDVVYATRPAVGGERLVLIARVDKGAGGRLALLLGDAGDSGPRFGRYRDALVLLHQRRRENDRAGYERLLTDYLGVDVDGGARDWTGPRRCLRAVLLGYLRSYEVVQGGNCLSCNHCVPDERFAQHDDAARAARIVRLGPRLAGALDRLAADAALPPGPALLDELEAGVAAATAAGQGVVDYLAGWTAGLLDEAGPAGHRGAWGARLLALAAGWLAPQPDELARALAALADALADVPVAVAAAVAAHLGALAGRAAARDPRGGAPAVALGRARLAATAGAWPDVRACAGVALAADDAAVRGAAAALLVALHGPTGAAPDPAQAASAAHAGALAASTIADAADVYAAAGAASWTAARAGAELLLLAGAPADGAARADNTTGAARADNTAAAARAADATDDAATAARAGEAAPAHPATASAAARAGWGLLLAVPGALDGAPPGLLAPLAPDEDAAAWGRLRAALGAAPLAAAEELALAYAAALLADQVGGPLAERAEARCWATLEAGRPLPARAAAALAARLATPGPAGAARRAALAARWDGAPAGAAGAAALLLAAGAGDVAAWGALLPPAALALLPDAALVALAGAGAGAPDPALLARLQALDAGGGPHAAAARAAWVARCRGEAALLAAGLAAWRGDEAAAAEVVAAATAGPGDGGVLAALAALAGAPAPAPLAAAATAARRLAGVRAVGAGAGWRADTVALLAAWGADVDPSAADLLVALLRHWQRRTPRHLHELLAAEAEALLAAGRLPEAHALYHRAPNLLLGIARAPFGERLLAARRVAARRADPAVEALARRLLPHYDAALAAVAAEG